MGNSFSEIGSSCSWGLVGWRKGSTVPGSKADNPAVRGHGLWERDEPVQHLSSKSLLG